MMILFFPSTVALVVVLIQLLVVIDFVVYGEKDSDYYYPGFVNPNSIDNKMYWKDSINILQDLDQFQSLYIKYHHCVWSKYGTRYGTGEDYDEQGAEQDEQEDNNGDDENGGGGYEINNGCGGWGGEYFWYMGRTQCFRANVAYSLYGILKSDNNNNGNTNDSNAACNKETYINSFFTTFGVESFAGPLGLGVDVNSQCYAIQPDNNNNNNEEDGDQNYYYNDAAADDDYINDDFIFYDYETYSSYGTGCSSDRNNKKFVKDQYTGAFCKGRKYEQTLDTLDDFNTAVEELECTQIYNANNNNDRNKRQRRKLADDDEDGYDFDEMDAIDILSFSKSCSLRQYPNDCPDPYGLKKKYGKRIDNAFQYKTGRFRNSTLYYANIATYVCLVAGIIFLGLAYSVHYNSMSNNKKRQRNNLWNFINSRRNKDTNKSNIMESEMVEQKKKKEPIDDGTKPSIFEEIVSSKGSTTDNNCATTATTSNNNFTSIVPWSSFGKKYDNIINYKSNSSSSSSSGSNDNNSNTDDDDDDDETKEQQQQTTISTTSSIASKKSAATDNNVSNAAAVTTTTTTSSIASKKSAITDNDVSNTAAAAATTSSIASKKSATDNNVSNTAATATTSSIASKKSATDNDVSNTAASVVVSSFSNLLGIKDDDVNNDNKSSPLPPSDLINEYNDKSDDGQQKMTPKKKKTRKKSGFKKDEFEMTLRTLPPIVQECQTFPSNTPSSPSKNKDAVPRNPMNLFKKKMSSKKK